MFTANLSITPAQEARPGGHRIVHRVLGQVSTWAERARSRRILREMDDRMLSDFAVTPSEVWLEARKPFWRS
ncbi:MAG: DUF1127 domain-containing protein [Acetobacteraceae bacterium]